MGTAVLTVGSADLKKKESMTAANHSFNYYAFPYLPSYIYSMMLQCWTFILNMAKD